MKIRVILVVLLRYYFTDDKQLFVGVWTGVCLKWLGV